MVQLSDVAFLVAPAAAGFSTSALLPAYSQCGVRPWLQPPGWAFGAAWAVLYVAVGVAGMLAWRRNGRRWSPALLAWAVATALVVCWPLAFMNGRLCLPVGAFCGMLAVTAAATAATALLLHERLLVPAVLMLALLCWLLFASLLSFLSIP